jgi:hypothetical protein
MLLFEIVTGKRPFHEKKFASGIPLLRAVSDGARPEFPDDIPAESRQLIEKCWSPVPGDRPRFIDMIADSQTSFVLPDTDEGVFFDFVRDVLEGRLHD